MYCVECAIERLCWAFLNDFLFIQKNKNQHDLMQIEIIPLWSSEIQLEMIFLVIFDFVKKKPIKFFIIHIKWISPEYSAFDNSKRAKIVPFKKLFIPFKNHRRTLKTLKVVKIVFISIITNNWSHKWPFIGPSS